jgi:hypothetical protein
MLGRVNGGIVGGGLVCGGLVGGGIVGGGGMEGKVGNGGNVGNVRKPGGDVCAPAEENVRPALPAVTATTTTSRRFQTCMVTSRSAYEESLGT